MASLNASIVALSASTTSKAVTPPLNVNACHSMPIFSSTHWIPTIDWYTRTPSLSVTVSSHSAIACALLRSRGSLPTLLTNTFASSKALSRALDTGGSPARYATRCIVTGHTQYDLLPTPDVNRWHAVQIGVAAPGADMDPEPVGSAVPSLAARGGADNASCSTVADKGKRDGRTGVSRNSRASSSSSVSSTPAPATSGQLVNDSASSARQ
mmetsp:Transcript_21096/g.68010  ORF Transcript_21096/g.68010 Transcript_21096/m.68010 type:complete len:211 (-) Transcript_21096:46-678(-)